MSNESHPFEVLTPDWVLESVESQGFECDGRLTALNSYENRVYQVGIEEQDPVIVKFYRPNRWSIEQVQEEHEFAFAMADQELPVVAPLKGADGNSLFRDDRFLMSIYPRKGGYPPELYQESVLKVLGRLLGRMHLIGAVKPFEHRPHLDLESFGIKPAQFVIDHFIPLELKAAYESLVKHCLEQIAEKLERFSDVARIRVHGDCHGGNLLWRDDSLHFVDLDDARMAPAIQDLWMLTCGTSEEQSWQLEQLLKGYREFSDFDSRELQLVEVFRTLRMIHYSAWLARRWDDPAFPMAFTWFNSPRYWSDHILQLREQLAALTMVA